jgi:hypothetical protein
MHRLAHRLVAAERERQVGDAAGNMRVRQVGADPARRLDEIDAVIIVLFEPRGDRKDIGIEDDVLRRSRPVDQDVGRRACRSGLRANFISLPGPRRTPSPRRRARWQRDQGLVDEFLTPSFIEIEFTPVCPERISGRPRSR